jgi:lipoate-protein ligase A
MRFLELTLPSLPENLALDEALLLEAEEAGGGEVLRLWKWPKLAVVLGAGGIITEDVNEAECAAEAIPLARRSSGGGTVLLGPGCLLFSLVLDTELGPALQQIHSSYRFILERVAAALAPVQAGLEFAGTSDLAVVGRKLSGNSQQRKRRFILHHGTLLHSFDFDLMNRYLKVPPRRPEYRGERNHVDFLMNLPDRPEDIVACLRRGWQADLERIDWPEERVRKLVAERFERDDWIRRR